MEGWETLAPLLSVAGNVERRVDAVISTLQSEQRCRGAPGQWQTWDYNPLERPSEVLAAQTLLKLVELWPCTPGEDWGAQCTGPHSWLP